MESNTSQLFRLPSVAFETILFCLTFVSFFKSVRREYGRHSILFVFLRDGTWAFTIIFGKQPNTIYSIALYKTYHRVPV